MEGIEGKYLITTDNWFLAPDGVQYRAVWGDVSILSDDVLGIKTNSRSTNWYLQVGSKDDHVIVAGCQIHYAVKCTKAPNSGRVKDATWGGGSYQEFERESQIYITK